MDIYNFVLTLHMGRIKFDQVNHMLEHLALSLDHLDRHMKKWGSFLVELQGHWYQQINNYLELQLIDSWTSMYILPQGGLASRKSVSYSAQMGYEFD